MSAKDDSLKTTGRIARAEQRPRDRSARGREAPARMTDPRRRYLLITMFSVLAAITFLVLVVILVAPGEVADAGLRGSGMIWGLLVLKVIAAAMLFTLFMFMLYRNGTGAKQ